MFGIGFGEFAIIFVVLIVAVGPEKLPTFMKTVGKTIRGLRQASRDIRTAVGIDELLREDIELRTPTPVRRPAPPPGQPVGRSADGGPAQASPAADARPSTPPASPAAAPAPVASPAAAASASPAAEASSPAAEASSPAADPRPSGPDADPEPRP